ncbi:MAG: GNAT family N-acetyltransferase [Anaerolineales bacterium]|jgi:predicted GNAT family N-acyltransferase|nr:GNAT family N-acetyltransferase [Anaerolineales bacterium]
MRLTFRPYQAADQAACLALFDGNTPPYFDPSERPAFESFLERQACPFFVLEQNGQVVACGGYCHQDPGEIVLAWGMVQRSLHQRGLGSILLSKRIEKILQDDPRARIVIDTSQHSQAFFARRGFRVSGGTENYYGPGLHRVDMEYCPK